MIKKMSALLLFLVIFVQASAFAHPGVHELSCESAPGNDAHSVQTIQFSLRRSNGVGWFAPSFNVTVDSSTYDFDPPDEMKNYGLTTRDGRTGKIEITGDNIGDGELNQGSFSVKAISGTVKVLDSDGNPIPWPYTTKKNDGCFDRNGKATFQATFKGTFSTRNDAKSKAIDIHLIPARMNCELSYKSGMAC
jgi:hypothetical protein